MVAVCTKLPTGNCQICSASHIPKDDAENDPLVSSPIAMLLQLIPSWDNSLIDNLHYAITQLFRIFMRTPPEMQIRSHYLAFGKPDFGEAEIEALTRVMRTGWVGMGPETISFEEELAAYIGVPKQGPYKPDTYRY